MQSGDRDRSGLLSTFRAQIPAASLILLLATAVLLPAFIRGFPAGADARRQYRWANGFFDGLREGTALPRWLSGGDRGLGSPTFIFYPPLVFYVASGFRVIVGSQVQALSLAAWLGMLGSGFTMYTFARSTLSKRSSVFAALLYMLIPAHVFELYQLSALAEFWSFAWIPLVLDAARRTATGQLWAGVPYLGLSYALLILTHVPLTFATTLILPLYVLLLTRDLRRLSRVAAGLLLGAGLGAIFIVPVLLERKYVRSSMLLARFDYHDYFAFDHIASAFKPPFFSTDQSVANYVLENEPAAVGLAMLLAIASIALWDGRRVKQNTGKFPTLPAVWVVTALALLLTTRLSEPAWKAIPGLAYLPFPGRWLVIVSAGVCFLAAAAVSVAQRSRARRMSYRALMAAAIVFNVWVTGLSVKRAPNNPEGIDPGPYFNEERFFEPIWWDRSVQHPPEEFPATIKAGTGSVGQTRSSPAERSYGLIADTESTLKLDTLYFPGWRASVDGAPVDIGPGEDGLIELLIPPGKHTLDLRFEDTPARTAGKLISGLSLLILVGTLYSTRRRRASSVAAGSANTPAAETS